MKKASVFPADQSKNYRSMTTSPGAANYIIFHPLPEVKRVLYETRKQVWDEAKPNARRKRTCEI